MAVDGTVLDVPDSKANARVFGYPGSRPGTQAAFPKVRLVMLVEALRVRGRLRRETLLQRRLTGTHLIVDAIRVSLPYRRASPS